MIREALLAELEVAFRESFPDRAPRLLREVDRWCREAADPEKRDWRWFDAGDGDAAAMGKFDRERVESFRCSFCARTLLQANRMIGLWPAPPGVEPKFTLEGYRHPVDKTPVGKYPAAMMCDFCVLAYHERFADEDIVGAPLPDAEMLIADAARALRARHAERAEETIAEMEKRRSLALPRQTGVGGCRVCSAEGTRIVLGPTLTVCSKCIARARYSVGVVVAVGAR